jgi:hypothetical protein
MKKMGMFCWAFGFALLLGFAHANSAEVSEGITVRIGVLADTQGKYFRHLRDKIGKNTNCEVLQVQESKSYHNLDIEMGRILGQKYQIDMLIGVTTSYKAATSRGHTKLIDISGQRLVELKPVRIGYTLQSPGWEKKMVKKHIGAIEKMIEEISSQEKGKSKP